MCCQLCLLLFCWYLTHINKYGPRAGHNKAEKAHRNYSVYLPKHIRFHQPKTHRANHFGCVPIGNVTLQHTEQSYKISLMSPVLHVINLGHWHIMTSSGFPFMWQCSVSYKCRLFVRYGQYSLFVRYGQYVGKLHTAESHFPPHLVCSEWNHSPCPA